MYNTKAPPPFLWRESEMFHLQTVSEQLKSEQWLRLACKWLVSHWGQLLSRTRSPRHFSMETLSERDGDGDAAKRARTGSEILQHFRSSLYFSSLFQGEGTELNLRIIIISYSLEKQGKPTCIRSYRQMLNVGIFYVNKSHEKTS